MPTKLARENRGLMFSRQKWKEFYSSPQSKNYWQNCQPAGVPFRKKNVSAEIAPLSGRD